MGNLLKNLFGAETNVCIQTMFEEIANAIPDSVALVFEGRQMTFDELNSKANQLARFLQSKKIGPDVLVGVMVERSFDMIISILAILKAGGAYLPLDHKAPVDRIKYMLEDAKVPLILTQEQLIESLPANIDANIFAVDTEWNTVINYPDTNILNETLPNNIAYTIYTSGSTGKPKGVQVEHRSLANLIIGTNLFLNNQIKRFLYAYSFAFDGAVYLIWWALLDGGTLVIAPEELEKDVNELAKFIQHHQITNVLTFPSLYSLVLEQVDPKLLSSLEIVSVAGEACPAYLANKHHTLLKNTQFLNQYGPTEATVGATIYITPKKIEGEKVPIGTPIPNVSIYILDEELNQVPVGEIGEIHIAGNGVARGYLNRLKLTDQKFIGDPFSEYANDRMYKTGDLGKWLPDGNIDFIGRIDHQIKLRGYRIELGEIEAVITQHELVREAIVNVVGETTVDQKLIGYIVPFENTGKEISTLELKEFLRLQLPDYMVPADFMILDNMPLTIAGKVDRKALSIPNNLRPELEHELEEATNDLEHYLVDTWKDILGINEIGIHDKFFELGGNSLQAGKFVGKVSSDLQEQVFIVSIFNTPTIAEYANFLEKEYQAEVNRFLNKEVVKDENVFKATEQLVLDTTDFRNFEKVIPSSPPFSIAPHKNKQAVFILAPPRSGTSLLRLMLAGHPKLFAANELQLLGFETLAQRQAAFEGKFSLWSEGLIRVIMHIKQCGPEEAKLIIENYANEGVTTKELFGKLQQWIGKKIMVDKSPSYALDPKILEKANNDFKNALFIQLIRHPYAMVSSFKKMRMDQAMYLNDHDFNTAQTGELIWTKSHENINEFFKNIPKRRIFRIRYEELVTDPKKVMKTLCKNFNWEYSPVLINPYLGIENKMTDGIYKASAPMGDPNLLKKSKIDATLADKWKGVLDDNFLADETWEMAQKFGYQHPEDINVDETENQIEQKNEITTSSLKGEKIDADSGLNEKITRSNDIAIVGMSIRVAGAENIDEFWHNLISEKDVSVVYTKEDLIAEGIDPSVLQDEDYVNRGMPLKDYQCFDHKFFGYTPNESALMDPQHRIYLQQAYKALEHAGYDAEKYPGKIGIVGGIARNTYLVNNVITHPNFFKSIEDFQLGITLEKDFPATRVAYKLNLKGPAINVQTACSSSGVALHLACQSLLAGDSNMMLVGGGRIQPPVYKGHIHHEGHALSPDGYCRAFDATAQGMVRGNGMAFIVIKKLEDAIKDGDSIHAVIKSTAINNDGTDKIGFTAPSISGQSAAIIDAYKKAGISPETISYIEAHGTGTRIGDPIEVASLSKAFKVFTNKKSFCPIGSVKTNIGHLDAGACIAGIIKTVLSLKNEVIPPSLHFDKPNPEIDFKNSPFFVNTNLRPWNRTEAVRRAGISSFGLGGTNVHVVLEEAPITKVSQTGRSHELILLSAKTERALAIQMNELADKLKSDQTIQLNEAAATLQTGRKHFNNRMMLVETDLASAAAGLSELADISIEKNTVDKKKEVVFMFPGGGAQHTNMAIELYRQEKVFQNAVDTCLSILQNEHSLDLKKILYPDHNESKPILDPLHGITLLFTIEYATAQLWLSWGVEPKEMIGHSLGEYTAACIAGVFSLKDAIGMVATRGQLFKTLNDGGMLSVPMSEKEIAPYVNGNLSFAAINKPDNCVLSGATGAIEKLKTILDKKEINSSLLHITVAAHSEMVEPILEKFEQYLNGVTFHEPSYKILSNVYGDFIDDAEIQTPKYWVKHLRNTVRFSDGIGKLLGKKNRIFLEIGPGQTLSTFTRQHPIKQKEHVVLASLRHPKESHHDMAFLMTTLGRLWLQGIEIDWMAFNEAYQAKKIGLPTYPFAKTKHWIAPKEISRENSDQQLQVELKKHIKLSTTIKGSNMKKIEVVKMNRIDLIQRDVKEIFHALSGIPLDELNSRASFLELGFDSLFLTQAIAKLKKKFKVNLSFRQLLEEFPNIAILSKHFDNNLSPDAYQEEIKELELKATASQPIAPTSEVTTPISTSQPVPPVQKISIPQIQPIHNLSPDDANNMQQVIQQQLLLMQQQIALLSGSGISTTPVPSQEDKVVANKESNLKSPVPPTQLNTTPTSNPQSIGKKQIDGEGEKFGPWQPIAKKDNDGLSDQQRKYLNKLIYDYTTKTKSSQALTQAQRKHLSDPRSIQSFHKLWKDMAYQIAVEKSKGSKFWDLDGNEYVDYRMAFGISLFGHTPSFIQEAVKEQLEKGFELGVLTPLARKVADLLAELTGCDRVTLLNTGSEALSASVRAARTVTGKDKIIVFEGDYHGINDEFLVRSIRRGNSNTSMPISPGIPTSAVENVIVLRYSDEDIIEQIEKHADDLAAVLIEPIQPANPQNQYFDLFKAIRKVTEENNIALIFDEMITGFRTAIGGAQEWFNVRADIIAYGKIISGGLPMAAVAGKSRFLDAFDGGMWQFGDDSIPEAGVTFYGGTFVKHPLSLAAAYAMLTEIKRQGPKLYEQLNENTARFAQRLKELFIRTKVPMTLNATASVIAFKQMSNNPLVRLFFFYCKLKGVHLQEKAMLVSTAHTQADFDFTYKVMEESIREMQTAGFFPITVIEKELEHNIVLPPDHLNNNIEMNGTSIPIINEKNIQQNNNNGHTNKVSKKKIPLTEGQQEIWVEQQLGDEAAAAYNLSSEIRLEGDFQMDKFESAVQLLIDRHEALRVEFERDGLFQNFVTDRTVTIPFIDISHKSAIEQEQHLELLRKKESDKPLDLFSEPAYRFKVVKLSNQSNVIFFTVHHMIADGWSLGILNNDLAALYTAECCGVVADLGAPKQLSDFAVDHQSYLKSNERKAAETYWASQFEDDIPILEFPTDRSRPPVKTYDAAWESIHLDKDLAEKLKQLAKSQGSTLYILFYTAYQTFLQRLSQQDDFVLGIVAASQAISGNENLVAHGVNLLPVRMKTNKEHSFAEHLKAARGTILDAFENQNYSLGALVKKLKLPRDASRQPIISFLFNMDSEIGNLQYDNLKSSLRPVERNFETFDTFINVKPATDGIVFEWIYNTDLFDKETIQLRLQEFRILLESIVANPSTKVTQIPVLTPEEESLVLDTWNSKRGPYPNDVCIHELIEKQADQTPFRVAAMFKNEEISYASLNKKANQIAYHLYEAGVRPGDMVGIFMDRSIDMLTGLLGIMKTGGIYVPLDPGNPKDRLNIILEDAQAKFLLTNAPMQNRLPEINGLVIDIDLEKTAIARHPKVNPQFGVKPDNFVYVIYTSGSTGNPKGVMIPHFAVIDNLLAMQEAIGIKSTDAILGVASISFDPSVQDFFLPLMIGAKIIIAGQDELTDGYLLKERLELSNATLMQATPATWRMLLAAGWEGGDHFKVLCGGEGLTKELSQELINRSYELYNIYGPTETTIWSTYKLLRGNRTKTKMDSGYEPVGRPIKNVFLYLLDNELQPVPIGAAGEVYVGGVGVAPQGYFKRPALTANKFVHDPFSKQPGARMYRTGDIARYLKNGDLEYLHRADNQVKIRGYRIELGEIESAISQNSQIREVVVIVREDQPDNKYIAAYVILKNGAELDPVSMKRELKSKLPDYMVPTAFVQMDTFPLTATLKINRNKLPVPKLDRNDLETGYVAANSENEKIVHDIWATQLGIKNIGVNDNFFELGGHSLIAVKMMAQIEKTTGKKLPLSLLLENPTIKSLAYLLNEDAPEKNVTSLVAVKKEGKKIPIYIVHGAGLHVLLFKSLADNVDADQPVYALQAKGINGEAEPLESIEEMAEHYVEQILQHNPNGPYMLAGYSFGGLIAFEMAKQLKKKGKEIVMLGMFDTIVRPYITRKMDDRSSAKRTSDKIKKAAWVMGNFVKSPIGSFKYRSFTTKRKIGRLFHNAFGKKQSNGEVDFLAKVDRANFIAYENYVVTPYDGTIHLFRAKENRFYLKDFEFLGWLPYVKEVVVKEVPGDHLNLFDGKNGVEFAAILQETMDILCRKYKTDGKSWNLKIIA